MAQRTIAADLVRLLSASADPLYVLDDERRIAFVNEACATWAGCSASALVGQECRYHSSPEVEGAAAVAAALAPPPDVWMGQRQAAVVTLADADGREVGRHVEFVPLGSDALEISGVMAFARSATADSADSGAGNNDGQDDSSALLHERLRSWRRKLAGRYHLDRLVGESPAMEQVRRQVEVAMGTAACTSVVGPAGSGRQHVARTIHYGRVPAAAGALVPLECPFLTTGLLESTLRGLTRATTTNAPSRPATLLLSDVEQLPAEAQEYLARSLPAGGGIRILAISPEPLVACAARGELRMDLACALATIEIRLPALVDRLADLPLLAQLFLEDENRRGERQKAGFATAALDWLMAYSWPGNVAELAEVVSTAHRQAEGAHVQPADLPDKLRFAQDAAARPRRAEQTIVLEEFLGRIEEELIRRALDRAKGNKTAAARLLGMTRPRLYRRLVQLGIATEEDD